MSFDIFVNCIRNEEECTFPLAVVEEVFGAFIEGREPTCWTLLFPDGGRSFLYVRDQPNIAHFCVNRPVASPELWQGLFDILRRTGSMLFWPGGGSVVADASVIARLGPGIIRSIGPVTIVHEPSEIIACIEAS